MRRREKHFGLRISNCELCYEGQKVKGSKVKRHMVAGCDVLAMGEGRIPAIVWRFGGLS